jgi:hypothetical protein
MKDFKLNLSKKVANKILTYFLLAIYVALITLYTLKQISEKEFLIATTIIAIIIIFRFMRELVKSGFFDQHVSPLFLILGIVFGAYFFTSMFLKFMPEIDRLIRLATILFVFAYPTLRLIIGPNYLSEPIKHRANSKRVSKEVLSYILGIVLGVASSYFCIILAVFGLSIDTTIGKIIEWL